METSVARKAAYGLTSFLLGAWAFAKVNEITGPTFEPIIAACTNPDISLEDFEAKTGYHVYDRRVGLKAFDFLVCLITQFMLELRETHPAGLLVWGGVVVVTIVTGVIITLEAGRAGARGPIRYPTILGLLFQLFGISVIFPMVWVPSFVLGEGVRGSPLTSFRINLAGIAFLPAIVLTVIVFLADTDSQLWTTSAGMLGGPMLASTGLAVFTDASPNLVATKESARASSVAVSNICKVLMVPGLISWYILAGVAYQSYGTSLGSLWNDIWVNAGPSVCFMTIDTGVLYLAVLLFLAYRHGESKAGKALVLTPILGPAVSALLVLSQAENEMDFAHLNDVKKED